MIPPHHGRTPGWTARRRRVTDRVFATSHPACRGVVTVTRE